MKKRVRDQDGTFWASLLSKIRTPSLEREEWAGELHNGGTQTKSSLHSREQIQLFSVLVVDTALCHELLSHLSLFPVNVSLPFCRGSQGESPHIDQTRP